MFESFPRFYTRDTPPFNGCISRGRPCTSPTHLVVFKLIAKFLYSLLLLIGRFWMLPFSLNMLKHLSERRQALTRRCMSPFSIGFLAYVRCSDTWLSTSSTRIGSVGTKASETREQCGELDCFCSSDSL